MAKADRIDALQERLARVWVLTPAHQREPLAVMMQALLDSWLREFGPRLEVVYGGIEGGWGGLE
jgi:hypothetical protein